MERLARLARGPLSQFLLPCFNSESAPVRVLLDASALRAVSRGGAQIADALMERVLRLEVSWDTDAYSEADSDDDVERECWLGSDDLLRLPWRHLHVKDLTIGNMTDEDLNDEFISKLMRELDKSRSSEINLSIVGSQHLARPLFDSKKVVSLEFGGYHGGYQTGCKRIVIPPQLRHLKLFDADELERVLHASWNTLETLEIYNREPEDWHIASCDIANLLTAHADSLRSVVLQVKSEPEVVLQALARLSGCERVAVRFHCSLKMQDVLPLLARVRSVALLFAPRKFNEVGFGGIVPVLHDADRTVLPLRVESLMLYNLGDVAQWAHCVRACSSLRYFEASVEHNWPRGFGSFLEGRADVPVLPPSITHIYETPRGVVGTAGAWGRRAKLAVMHQLPSAEVFDTQHQRFVPRVPGPEAQWIERANGVVQRTAMSTLEAKFGPLWMCHGDFKLDMISRLA